MWFPETRRAWRRMKLLLVELVLINLHEPGHSLGYYERLDAAMDAVGEFRENYYPALKIVDAPIPRAHREPTP